MLGTPTGTRLLKVGKNNISSFFQLYLKIFAYIRKNEFWEHRQLFFLKCRIFLKLSFLGWKCYWRHVEFSFENSSHKMFAKTPKKLTFEIFSEGILWKCSYRDAEDGFNNSNQNNLNLWFFLQNLLRSQNSPGSEECSFGETSQNFCSKSKKNIVLPKNSFLLLKAFLQRCSNHFSKQQSIFSQRVRANVKFRRFA